MELVNKILEKIAAPSAERVGIYVSADSKMEVVVYNVETEEVKKYEKIELPYNHVLREIGTNEFEAAVSYLTTNLEIPSNVPVCVSLPNILTSVKDFPADLEDLELEVAISSEAEKSYIFKKADPRISWIHLSSNNGDMTNEYLYSVVQRAQTEEIARICRENRLNLVSIDVSFTSLLRGLAVSGVLEDNIKERLKWCIVIISANNYLIAKFDGKKLVDIIETPLALKSIEQDVLYTTLNNNISEKLQDEKLDNLYVVSQTEDFAAEKLTDQMKIMCNIFTIDNNKFNDNSLFQNPLSVDDPVSIESVGAACWNNSKLDVNFNFLDLGAQGELHGLLGQIGVRKPIHFYLLIGVILSFLFVVLLYASLFGINSYYNSQIAKHSSEINKLKNLDESAKKEFNLNGVMNRVYRQNLDLLASYDSFGAVIPEKLWIESFIINNNLEVKLKGRAYRVEDIVTYFENLQKMSKFRNIKITSIEITSEENLLSTKTSEPSGDGLDLPPPPMPENSSASNKSYYEFIFDNYKDSDKKDSIINNLPDFTKKLFGK